MGESKISGFGVLIILSTLLDGGAHQLCMPETGVMTYPETSQGSGGDQRRGCSKMSAMYTHITHVLPSYVYSLSYSLGGTDFNALSRITSILFFNFLQTAHPIPTTSTCGPSEGCPGTVEAALSSDIDVHEGRP